MLLEECRIMYAAFFVFILNFFLFYTVIMQPVRKDGVHQS